MGPINECHKRSISIYKESIVFIRMKTLRVLFAMLFFLCFSISIANAEKLKRSSSLQTIVTVNRNVERIDYIDDDGTITYAADKHYASMIQTKEDNAILIEYLDAKGKPVEQSNGYYGVLQEYDEEGRICKSTYLGVEKHPIMTKLGYAIVHHSYYENGKLKTDSYYDLNDAPVQSKYDGFGSYREYDEEGRNTCIIHLDKNGEPMIAGNGYAMIKRSYYESGPSKGLVKYEYYYDDKNAQISLSYGQYGLYKEYDELRRCTLFTYLDAFGYPTLSSKGYATVKRNFYEDDTVKTEMYFDRQGEPIKIADGQYGILRQKNKVYYLDKEGNRYFDLKNYLLNSQISVLALGIFTIVLSTLSNHKVNIIMLISYMGIILYLTRLHRANATNEIILQPLWSYKQFFSNQNLRMEIINNIFRFIPLGVISYHVYPKGVVILLPLLLSVFIESIQFFASSGMSELDDVISNCFGGYIGLNIGKLTYEIKQRIKNRNHLHSA